MKKMLIVTDGKAGHENQSKAFCGALGYGFDLLHVSYQSGAKKALAYLSDRLGLLTTPFESDPLPDSDYAAVVATGSTAFYPGKVMARRLKVPAVAILYPKGYRLDFDCILAPVFDNPVDRPNIIPIPVNLTSADKAFYERGVQAFHERYKPQGKGVGVIIGGPNGFAEMSVGRMKNDLEALFARTEGMERWVTTSRRTPPEVEALVDSLPFDYKLLYSKDHFNPIPAFVSLCDRLFVTADSTGMISEAVTRGNAKVEVLMNLRDDNSKFARFVHNLERLHAVHCFDGTLGVASEKVDLVPIFAKARELIGL